MDNSSINSSDSGNSMSMTAAKVQDINMDHHANGLGYHPHRHPHPHEAVQYSSRKTSDSSSSVSPTGMSNGNGNNSSSSSNNKGSSSKGSNAKKLCEVCQDHAKSLHFGGLSCDSCKAFFRRSVHKDAHLQFNCGFNGACEITKSNRKSCQKCRFEKCLQIGMEKKWVMSEEERKALNKQRVQKKTAQQTQGSQSSSSWNNASSMSNNKGSPSSSEERYDSSTIIPPTQTSPYQPIQQSSSSPLQEYVPRVDEMLHYMTLDEQKTIREIVEYYRISYDKIFYTVPETSDGPRDSIQVIGMFTTILRRFAYFSKLVPEFRDLCKDDQGNLLKASVLEMCLLRGALSFDIENHRWPNTNLEFLKNCPRLKVEEMENLVSPELFEMHMNFIKKLQQLKVDEPTVMLLLLIVMFYPERSVLQDVEKINDAQEKYCMLLQKYVNWRYGPQGAQLYPKLLTKLSDLRQLNDLHTEYHLNLAETEVNVIRQDLSQLQLDPYPQWKIVDGETSPNSDTNRVPQFPPIFSPPPPEVMRAGAGTSSYGVNPPAFSSPAPSAPRPLFGMEQRKRFRQAFLNRVPELIDDPFGSIISEQDIRAAAARFTGGGFLNNPLSPQVGVGAATMVQPNTLFNATPNTYQNPASTSGSPSFGAGGLASFSSTFQNQSPLPPSFLAHRSQPNVFQHTTTQMGNNMATTMLTPNSTPPPHPQMDLKQMSESPAAKEFLQNISPEARARLRAMFYGTEAPSITPGLFADIVTDPGIGVLNPNANNGVGIGVGPMIPNGNMNVTNLNSQVIMNNPPNAPISSQMLIDVNSKPGVGVDDINRQGNGII